MKRPLAILGICLILVPLGCGLPAAIGDVNAIREQVRRDLGVDCSINSHTMNGVTTVKVFLQALPPGPPAGTRGKVTSAVSARIPRAKTIEVYAKL